MNIKKLITVYTVLIVIGASAYAQALDHPTSLNPPSAQVKNSEPFIDQFFSPDRSDKIMAAIKQDAGSGKKPTSITTA